MGKAFNGYVAIARDIFEHPLFARRRGNKRFSRLEAWQWLIARAAWAPRGERRANGSVHLERGQVAGSLRTLGKTWGGWPKSNVHRFLRRLVRERMIALSYAPLVLTGTATGTVDKSFGCLITICNYDKFQQAEQITKRRHGQQHARDLPQLPGLLYEIAAKPLNQESFKKEATRDKKSPRHGQLWKNSIWLAHGTDEWEDAARHSERVNGVAVFPCRYRDRSGNWFERTMIERATG